MCHWFCRVASSNATIGGWKVKKIKIESVNDPKAAVLVCQRIGPTEEVLSNSLTGTCNRCQHGIWVHPSSPNCARIICNECLETELKDQGGNETLHLTPEQLETIKEYMREKDSRDHSYVGFDDDILSLADDKRLAAGPIVAGCGAATARVIVTNAENTLDPDRYISNAVHSTIACLLGSLRIKEIDQKLLQHHMDDLNERATRKTKTEGRPPNAKLN
jgi:hypothetical protein